MIVNVLSVSNAKQMSNSNVTKQIRMICSIVRIPYMRISDRSRTDFDRAKIKLTGHFDRRPISRYFEPCYKTKFESSVALKCLELTCIQANNPFVITLAGFFWTNLLPNYEIL